MPLWPKLTPSLAGGTRDEAEARYRFAMAWAPGWRDMWRVGREAADLAAGAEDFVLARKWMNAAIPHLTEHAAAEAITEAAFRYALYQHHLDTGDFTPPRRTSPTVSPSPTESAGVADSELTAAVSRELDTFYSRTLVRYPSRHDAALEIVDRRPPMRATICGTALRDDRGRLGIRDETTGETILVDYRCADHVEQDAALTASWSRAGL